MEGKEGREIIGMEGQTLSIRTLSIDEKCQAFETLVIYCSTLEELRAVWTIRGRAKDVQTLTRSNMHYFYLVFEADCEELFP
jgi:hypothetical protein